MEEKKRFAPYLITESSVLEACSPAALGQCPEAYQPFASKLTAWSEEPCEVDPITLEEIPAEYVLRFRSVIAPGATALLCRDVRVLKDLLERARFEKKYMSEEMLAKMGLPIDITFAQLNDPVTGLPYGAAQIEAIESHPYSKSFDVLKFRTQLALSDLEHKEKEAKQAAQHAFEEEQKMLREQFGVPAGVAYPAAAGGIVVYEVPGEALMAEVEAIQQALADAQDEMRQIQALLKIKQDQLSKPGQSSARLNEIMADIRALRLQAQDALLRVETLSNML